MISNVSQRLAGIICECEHIIVRDWLIGHEGPWRATRPKLLQNSYQPKLIIYGDLERSLTLRIACH